jgi:hypothetical protein
MKLANGLRAPESAVFRPDSAILRRRVTPVIGESTDGAAARADHRFCEKRRVGAKSFNGPAPKWRILE